MNWVQRAQVHLGTLVTIRIGSDADAPNLQAAFDQAFAVISHVSRVMSAHDPASDLGRLARAQPGEPLALDPHTLAVIRLAHYWQQASAGAFNPVRAAMALAHRRAAFAGLQPPLQAHWPAWEVCDGGLLRVGSPLWLDLGGLAKGYAVDQAIATLQACGVTHALVNAGGDLRAIGPVAWPVQAQHQGPSSGRQAVRTLRRLRNAALATSAVQGQGTAFVSSRPQRGQRPTWQACTVMAADCASADALTKWAMQALPGSPRLARVLRRHGAHVWRSA